MHKIKHKKLIEQEEKKGPEKIEPQLTLEPNIGEK